MLHNVHKLIFYFYLSGCTLHTEKFTSGYTSKETGCKIEQFSMYSIVKATETAIAPVICSETIERHCTST